MRKRQIFLIFFCYIVLIGTSFYRPLVMKRIMDQGMMAKDFQVILIFSGVLFALAVLEEALNILQAKLFTDLQNSVILNLYTKVFQRLLYAKMEYFSHNNSVEIMNRISTDIGGVGTLVDSSVMSIISYVLQIISGVIGLFVIDWKLAVLVLAIVPVKYLLIRFFSKRKEEAVAEWIQESTDFSAWFGDTINGMREVKLWNLYKKERRELRRRQKKVLELGKRSNLLETYNLSGDSILQWTVTSALYGIGGYLICGGSLTIGGLTAFISYSNYVIGPIALVFNLKFLFAQVKPSAKRLREFFKLETEKPSKPGQDIKELKEEIRFENVDFAYEDQPVLKDISLKIRKGEKIAIIGDNGSGKSTLISLLLRFLKPGKGSIYLDGKEIEEYDLGEYRDLFGVVSQDIYLFKDTVKANIAMGRKIDDEEMDRTCKMMNMQEFIGKLPQGYETRLEKNGENLSGGERQKIALLRAIIKKSPILVLDEATANIDKKYNELLHYNILKDFPDKTLIVITHKTENLAGMDRIYEIQNHAIKECDYAELEKSAFVHQKKKG